MLPVISILFLAYLLLLILLRWPGKIKTTVVKANTWPDVTVVVCARNEEQHLPACLESLKGQRYKGNYRIIFFDDFSSDRTLDIARAAANSRLEILEMKDRMEAGALVSNKKTAIEWGVEKSNDEFILVADADTRYNQDWLASMAPVLREGADFVAAPVLIDNPASLISWFQAVEYLAIQSATIRAVSRNWFHSASGANMGFRKSTFLELNGYRNSAEVASGDDIFLILKMAKAGKSIRYLDDPAAYAFTSPMKTWMDVLRQRVRWGAKARHYLSGRLNFPWFVIGLFNAVLCGVLLFALTGGFPDWLWIILVVWSLKIVVEYWFILPLSRVAGYRLNGLYFFLSGLIYPVFITVVSLTSAFRKEVGWKGRNVPT